MHSKSHYTRVQFWVSVHVLELHPVDCLLGAIMNGQVNLKVGQTPCYTATPKTNENNKTNKHKEQMNRVYINTPTYIFRYQITKQLLDDVWVHEWDGCESLQIQYHFKGSFLVWPSTQIHISRFRVSNNKMADFLFCFKEHLPWTCQAKRKLEFTGFMIKSCLVEILAPNNYKCYITRRIV